MNLDDKIKVIEEVLGFLLEEPFKETAADFPSPDDVVEDWYLTATIFRNIKVSQQIPDEHNEALHTLIGEAEAEFKAAQMLEEAPDTEQELGEGYDDDEIPEGFASAHQAAIWEEVIRVLGGDQRAPEWKLESD